jgi:hypothetical protein
VDTVKTMFWRIVCPLMALRKMVFGSSSIS